jgi:hypothetical protein
MPITRTPIIDDSGFGDDGTVLDNAWKQQLYDQIDGYVSGVWQYPAFAAGNFSAAAPGIWTVTSGQVLTQRWQRVSSKTVCYQVHINGAILSGGNSTTLYINLFGAVPFGAAAIPCTYFVDTAQQSGVVQINSGTSYLSVNRDFFGTPWTNTKAIYLAFSVTYETV